MPEPTRNHPRSSDRPEVEVRTSTVQTRPTPPQTTQARPAQARTAQARTSPAQSARSRPGRTHTPSVAPSHSEARVLGALYLRAYLTGDQHALVDLHAVATDREILGGVLISSSGLAREVAEMHEISTDEMMEQSITVARLILTRTPAGML